jgi:hypothetical protein
MTGTQQFYHRYLFFIIFLQLQPSDKPSSILPASNSLNSNGNVLLAALTSTQLSRRHQKLLIPLHDSRSWSNESVIGLAWELCYRLALYLYQATNRKSLLSSCRQRHLMIATISWLHQAKNDPSLSSTQVDAWSTSLETQLHQAATRYDFAKLFGDLLDEWLKSGDSLNTASLSEDTVMTDVEADVKAAREGTYLSFKLSRID